MGIVYSKSGTVTASMCDSSTALSPLAILQLVEDGVTDLMGDLHIDGLTAMREYGAMWVFVKNVIRIYHRPSWRTPFVLHSFISGHSAAKLMIDTEILESAEMTPIAHSRLELCALDLQTGSIRKAATVGVDPNAPCEPALPDLKYSRFPKHDAKLLNTVRVQSTNLDYCSHTNNIEYFRFILNAYQASELANREADQIEIHYGRQTHEGDVLSVLKCQDGATDYFSICTDKDIAVECKVSWKSQSTIQN